MTFTVGEHFEAAERAKQQADDLFNSLGSGPAYAPQAMVDLAIVQGLYLSAQTELAFAAYHRGRMS